MKEYGWLNKQRIRKPYLEAIKRAADESNRKINQQVEYIIKLWYEGLAKK